MITSKDWGELHITKKRKNSINLIIDKMLNELNQDSMNADNKIYFMHEIFNILSPLEMDEEATQKIRVVCHRLDLFTDPQHLISAYEEYLRAQNAEDKI